MAASSIASPLCTWLVATCMSVPYEKAPLIRSSSPFRSSKSSTLWARRRKRANDSCPSGLISAFGASSIQGLMSSCLALEPCDEYYSSKGSFLFGEQGFSLFLSKAPPTRRERRLSRTAAAGKPLNVAVEPAKEDVAKKRAQTRKKRIVVTGMGVVTPLGHEPDEFYNNLLEGVSGISEIEAFDCADFPTKIGGEIKSFSADGWVLPKFARRIDKFMVYIITAGKKALADGGMTEEVMNELDKKKCGILVGSAFGGLQVYYSSIAAFRISYKKLNPFCVPFSSSNMGSAVLAMDLGWMGPNYSISTACATSNFCILNAAYHIERGEADIMLCGGSDAALLPIGLGGFVACKALSQRNDDPSKASRPWDVDRDGFVLGEGAGVLLLEELEHAKKRGANIYAEFLGGSFTSDAYHATEPHPEGAGVGLCIEKALSQSGVAREDVNYVNAHAASTQSGDLKEYQALIRCFGENPELRVNSTKSMIGHLLGGAGAVEAVATVQAIRTGWVHPNINLENPEESVDPSVLVGRKKERLDIKVALSNSFGYGGHNCSILFAPYK